MSSFTPSEQTVKAKIDAQKIAFGPIMFHVAKNLRDKGLLKTLFDSRKIGLTIDEIKEKSSLSPYAISVLINAGISLELIERKEDKLYLSRSGYFILSDPMTKVNMDFVNDICYQGMFYLDKSIENEQPDGLKVFGKWDTIYQALSSLPENAKKSWFGFDHFYSDSAFPDVLPLVFSKKPKKLLDIGGNTGKWALKCTQYSKEVEVTIMDLPQQIETASNNVKEKSGSERIHFHGQNILDFEKDFPQNHDAIWMSQFLVCFSNEEIVKILKKCRKALKENGHLYILDTFIDKQEYEISSYCLNASSLYFTCMANGNSRMYSYQEFSSFLKEAGFKIEKEWNNLGISHSLLRCQIS